ncbi:transposase [Bacillus cereus]|nr:transposase [Bacillus cereus]
MICDLQSHMPLALLPNRESKQVTQWLKTYPHIEVVSRDGFTGFRQAISDANSSILQVYDRWHFIRNAKKQLEKILTASVPSTISWSTKLPIQPVEKMTKAEKEKEIRQNRKWELIQRIKQAHRAGKSMCTLAKEYKLSWKTIQKYIQMNGPPSSDRYKKNLVRGFDNLIIQLESKSHTLKEIDQLIRLEGYSGTFSAVRTVVETLRRNRKQGHRQNPVYHVSRQQLIRWFWIHPEQLNKKEKQDFVQCFSKYPEIRPLYQMVQNYRESVKQSNYKQFLNWLKQQLSHKQQPFYHYARRLRSDLQAIKHAFLLPYSNGVLEGQINRLKTIKRMVYGRAGLHVLTKRVLYRL